MIKEAELRKWVVGYLADFLSAPPEEIRTDAPFDQYGLDSADAVIFGGALEAEFDVEIDATIFLRNETIDALVEDMKQIGLVEP